MNQEMKQPPNKEDGASFWSMWTRSPQSPGVHTGGTAKEEKGAGAPESSADASRAHSKLQRRQQSVGLRESAPPLTSCAILG